MRAHEELTAFPRLGAEALIHEISENFAPQIPENMERDEIRKQ